MIFSHPTHLQHDKERRVVVHAALPHGLAIVSEVTATKNEALQLHRGVEDVRKSENYRCLQSVRKSTEFYCMVLYVSVVDKNEALQLHRGVEGVRKSGYYRCM